MALLLILPLCLLFLLLLPNIALAQNLTINASLTAAGQNSSWLSPSGEFAFGFHKLENNNDLFLLAIWFDKIREQTVVWYAKDAAPAPKDSKVELTTDGLVLTDPQGKELWRSKNVIGVVASAALTDSGNFVLQDGDSVNWESFKDPADTILPSQTLDKGVSLTSKFSDTNFSRGRFQMLLQDDGDLVLTTINLPSDHANDPYYKSGTKGDSNSSSAGNQLVFNSSGYLFILRENGQRFYITNAAIPSTGNFYHRAVLNFDGVLTHYYRPKTTSTGDWTVLSFKPDDICKSDLISAGIGICGFNSICRLGTNQRPNCECPNGYSLLDPNDKYGSCKPNYTITCDEPEIGPVEELYDFEVLEDIDWPTSDYALLQPFTEEGCRQSCLQDCMCSVAIFRSGDMCWKKKLPLSNGRPVDPSLNAKALIKVRKGNVSRTEPQIKIVKKNRNGDIVVVGSVLLGVSAFANILLVSAMCLGYFFVCKRNIRRIPHQESSVETILKCFTYKELEEATDGFKEELGRGAFGTVYKGFIYMMGSRINLAVKKLHTVVKDRNKEFKTEVNVIGQTHHKNLVRLLGYCDDGDHQLVVYEFLSNGALSGYLFGDTKPNWKDRIQIAFGIARGLLYLHEECCTQIIHCDIKPQNILLDEHYNARISDFGLAKLLSLDQSYTLTSIRGTKGYVAPDWFRNLPITVKVDVYSFGVLLLEIIACRRSVDNNESDLGKAILADWAYDCFCEGNFGALVEDEVEALKDRTRLESFLMTAIWCIQEDPCLRPTMRQVTQMLEGVIEVPVPPCPSPFMPSTN